MNVLADEVLLIKLVLVVNALIVLLSVYACTLVFKVMTSYKYYFNRYPKHAVHSFITLLILVAILCIVVLILCITVYNHYGLSI